MPQKSDSGRRGKKPGPYDAASRDRERTYRQTSSSGFHWTDDDFRSFETHAPRTSGSGGRNGSAGKNAGKRPRPSQSPQKRRTASDRRTSSGRRRQTGGRPPAEPQKKKRKRRRIPRSLRHFLIVAGFLTALATTILIAITMIFKVDTITVSGSSMYSDAEIVGICGYQIGDSLFFLSTTDKEELLQNELPYVEKAKITRRIPGTVHIDVTTVKVLASVSYEGQYVYVDSSDKIVELSGQVQEGSILVKGLELSPPVLAAQLHATDVTKQAAYTEIIAQVLESDAVEEITQIDLQDIYDIKIAYQNRIELLMGNTADLSFKLRFALSAVRDNAKVPANAQGSLDLSLANETNKATFNADYSGSVGGTVSSPSTGETITYEPFASNPGRGGDIPNVPYMGKASGTDNVSGSPEDGTSSDGSDESGSDDGGSSEDSGGEDEGNREDDNGI